jgi:hypothetical protein
MIASYLEMKRKKSQISSITYSGSTATSTGGGVFNGNLAERERERERPREKREGERTRVLSKQATHPWLSGSTRWFIQEATKTKKSAVRLRLPGSAS